MDTSLILVIDLNGEKLIFSARHDTTYLDILDSVRQKWKPRLDNGFKLRYTIKEGGLDNCCLDSDKEVGSLLILSQTLGAKLVYVNVVEQELEYVPRSASASFGSQNNTSCNLNESRDQTRSASFGFNQISANAFRKSSFEELSRPPKRSRSQPTAYEQSKNYPTYDVCPTHEEQHLLSKHWVSIISGKGQTFPGGATEFRSALAKYSSINGFKYHFNQNNKQRIYVVCQHRLEKESCKWFIRASEVKGCDGEFTITDSELNHTCDVLVGKTETKRMSAELMANLIESDVRENPKMAGKDVKRLLKNGYGIDISYKQAWRALEIARDRIFGSFETSFDQLGWYLEALLKTNPGSVVKLEQNKETGRFERAFIAFAATVEGFKQCRPMLFIDGTFMRGRWKGTVLAATAKDGNDGLYPVAFAMVQGETLENWKWFLELLRDNVKHEKPIYYISDRNTGLLSAFDLVWKKPLNFYCLVHLFNNLKGLYGSHMPDGYKIKMCGLLKRCAYAPTRRAFESEMDIFVEQGGEKARDWINNIEKEKWCVAFAPNILRYGEMTSNAAESFNHWIKDARALPITFMLDCIRLGIMRWFVERRVAASGWTSRLTDSMQNKWNAGANVCRNWGVLKVPNGHFEVRSIPNAVVNIEAHTCSCYQWQVTGFPCVHAIAVIVKNYKGLTGIVDQHYFTSTYIEAYKGDIYAVPETDKFEFTNVAGLKPILPPVKIAEKGRTKQKRIPSFGEFKKKKPWVCKKCNRSGRHDPITCALSV